MTFEECSKADEKCYKCGRDTKGIEWYVDRFGRAICLGCVFEVPEELRDEHR